MMTFSTPYRFLTSFLLLFSPVAAAAGASLEKGGGSVQRVVPVVAAEDTQRERWPAELHVEGRSLKTADGREVWLQGLNVGGLETLVKGTQILESFVVATEEWKANVIRLPVKEHFWFGRGGEEGKGQVQKDGGEAYRKLVDDAITLAANRGVYVILDLHRFRAPKAEHVVFWKDAASRYRNHPAVLFDLFNEPHTISWEVWRNGGFVEERTTKADEDAFLSEVEKAAAKQGFHSPGMQAMLDAVRSVGANNIVVVSGLEWSADLSGVISGYGLEDRTGNGIMYGWHIYNWHKDWDARILKVAEKHPILLGEVGADIKKMPFLPAEIQEDPYTWVPDMLGYIQKHRLNWTGWCFHPRATPIMITDWNYTPSPFWGAFAKEALAGKKFPLTRTR